MNLLFFQGIYFNFLGYFFSLYCMWKIFISTVNIVFDRVGRMDPISKGMEIAVNWFGLDIDVVFWSQHISFILVGAIVVTSVRGLLLTMSRFFVWISSPKSSSLIVLFLSQLMGMYFVSMVLLMRMNMPVQYRTIITEVLGDLQFNFYHRWFDVMFLVAAVVTIMILALAHKRGRDDETAMDASYHSEYGHEFGQKDHRSRERLLAGQQHQGRPGAAGDSFSASM